MKGEKKRLTITQTGSCEMLLIEGWGVFNVLLWISHNTYQ